MLTKWHINHDICDIVVIGVRNKDTRIGRFHPSTVIEVHRLEPRPQFAETVFYDLQSSALKFPGQFADQQPMMVQIPAYFTSKLR